MALVLPPGYSQMAYRFELIGDPELMVVTLGLDTTADIRTGQQLVTALCDQFLVGFPVSTISTDYRFRGGVLRWRQGSGAPSVYEDNRSVIGTSAGNPALPPNCAFLIRKTTSLGGRRGRGRMFLPPFSLGEGSIDATGTMQEAQRSVVQGRIDSAFGGTNPPKVVLHDGASGPPPDPSPILAYVLQHKIATQRRRLRP